VPEEQDRDQRRDFLLLYHRSDNELDDRPQFTVMVNNPAGSVTSNAATLTVIAAVPTVSFSRTSLTFGNHAVGASSSAQFVTFSNTGTGTLIFDSKPTQGDFSLASQGTCSTTSLAAGASCMLSIQFMPTTTGTRTGTLSVNGNASTTPQVAALTGLGVPNPPPTTILLGHLAILVEENTNYSSVTSSSAPYLAGFMVQYGLASRVTPTPTLRSATTSCSPLARSS
jgi:hypothetical protein